MLITTQTALLAKGQRNMHNSTKTIKYREVSADEHAPLLNHRHSTHHTHYSHDTELTDNPMPSTPPPTTTSISSTPRDTTPPYTTDLKTIQHLSHTTWLKDSSNTSRHRHGIIIRRLNPIKRHIHHQQNFLSECQGSQVHSHRRRL